MECCTINGVFPVEMRTEPTITTHGHNVTISQELHIGMENKTDGTINRNERQVTGL